MRREVARTHLASRRVGFTESVIREMTRLNAVHGGINLAQGFPNFPAPVEVKEAAKRSIDADINQYAITWGAPSLRQALARTYRDLYAMEVVVLEPFYENYGPDTAICGAIPVYVALRQPDNTFDPDELRRAFTAKT